MSDKLFNQIRKIYLDLKSPASFSSYEKLYQNSKHLGVTRSQIATFLTKYDSHSLQIVRNKHFIRRRFMTKAPGEIICSDVCYLKYYSAANDGAKFLIIFMDMYSRFVTVFPLKTLRHNDVIKAFETFTKNSIYSYPKIFTDGGPEYINQFIHKFYEKNNMLRYSTYQLKTKVSIVERFIRELRKKIAKYIIHFNSERYIHILQDLIYGLNMTRHRSLKNFRPLEIHLLYRHRDVLKFSKIIYASTYRPPVSIIDDLLKTGHTVGIRNQKVDELFNKSFFEQFTREIFKISRVNTDHVPITYSLSDLNGTDIKGIFYKSELTPVFDSGDYNVTILDTRIRNGIKQFRVIFNDYVHEKPQWIHKNQLVPLK